MMAYLALVRANLRMMFRSRDFLFWDLAFPVLLMILLASAFSHVGISAKIGVGGSGPMKEAIVNALHHVAGFSLTQTRHGAQAVRTGHLDASVFVHHNQVTILATSAPTSQIAATVIQGMVNQITIAMMHPSPQVLVSMQQVLGPSTSYVDFLVPGILAMSLMTSGIFSASFLVTARSQGILRRLRATPLSSAQFLLARYTSQLVLTGMETVILLGLARLLYGFIPAGSAVAFVLCLFLGSTAFLMMGFFVANLSATPEVAATVSNLINLPMMFLSGIFYSAGQLPRILRPLTQVLPLKYLADALRNIALSGQPLAQQGGPILILLATSLIFGGLATGFFKWDGRRV